jgi:hypothetical protein
VSRIVDESTLAFTRGFITEVTDRGFTATLSGALLNAGPFDALIEFPNGVEVFWQGFHIADIALPPICSAGGSGVPNLSTTGVLTIFDQTEFTRFAAFILANPSFEWTITTNTLRVTALGTIFDNVLISKKVSFQGSFRCASLPLSFSILTHCYYPFSSIQWIAGSRHRQPKFPWRRW